MPREEPYDSAEAQFAEDKKDNAGDEGGEGKCDKRGGNDSFRIVFPNNLGNVARENVEERLPVIAGHFLQERQGEDRIEDDVPLSLSSSCRFRLRNRYRQT